MNGKAMVITFGLLLGPPLAQDAIAQAASPALTEAEATPSASTPTSTSIRWSRWT